MAIPYTQDWALGNSTFTSMNVYERTTHGTDALYPNIRHAENVTVSSGRLDWNGSSASYQDAGVGFDGMGSLSGGGAGQYAGSGFWDGTTGYVECTYYPNSTSTDSNVVAYAPLITIANPSGVGMSLMAAADQWNGVVEVYRLRLGSVGSNYAATGAPLPSAGSPYKVKLCWQCSTPSGGGRLSDGWVRLYINDALEYDETGIAFYHTQNTSPEDLITRVHFGYDGLVGALDDITVAAVSCSSVVTVNINNSVPCCSAGGTPTGGGVGLGPPTNVPLAPWVEGACGFGGAVPTSADIVNSENWNLH
jgi:hypothetical protein